MRPTDALAEPARRLLARRARHIVRRLDRLALLIVALILPRPPPSSRISAYTSSARAISARASSSSSGGGNSATFTSASVRIRCTRCGSPTNMAITVCLISSGMNAASALRVAFWIAMDREKRLKTLLSSRITFPSLRFWPAV
jgi:hypothetical protein